MFWGLHNWHVRGPTKDWREVKDAVIMFGKEKVAFTEWLKGLNDTRWRKSWTPEWQNDELVNNIL